MNPFSTSVIFNRLYIDKNQKKDKEKLLKYLNDLKKIEARLWGINIKELKNGSEEILEDSNHLIYLLSKKNSSYNINKILKEKDFKNFLKNLNLLKEDFNYLKKKIKDKNKLKNLISSFTIKSIKPENYQSMKNIFLLEKKLYEEIEIQDKKLNELISSLKSIKFNNSFLNKEELLLDYLKKIRNILSGQQDLHHLWEEDRKYFSNTSNLIYHLIKLVKLTI